MLFGRVVHFYARIFSTDDKKIKVGKCIKLSTFYLSQITPAKNFHIYNIHSILRIKLKNLLLWGGGIKILSTKSKNWHVPSESMTTRQGCNDLFMCMANSLPSYDMNSSVLSGESTHTCGQKIKFRLSTLPRDGMFCGKNEGKQNQMPILIRMVHLIGSTHWKRKRDHHFTLVKIKASFKCSLHCWHSIHIFSIRFYETFMSKICFLTAPPASPDGMSA